MEARIIAGSAGILAGIARDDHEANKTAAGRVQPGSVNKIMPKMK